MTTRKSRATGNPRGRPPKAEQQERALAIIAAEPGVSTRSLARRVGASRTQVSHWRDMHKEASG